MAAATAKEVEAGKKQETTQEGKTCCKVNKNLLPYKSHYFLLNGAHVGVLPYLPVFAKSALGFSATTIGMLSTCMFFSTTLSKPLFGLLADCFSQMKIFIGALLSLEVILNLSMLALPRVDMGVLDLPFQSGLASSSSSWEQGAYPKVAQAMVYNATVVLHSKLGDDGDENSTTRYYSLQLRNLSESHISGEVPVYENLHEYRSYKCDLMCNGRIDSAVCHQNVKHCISPTTTSFLSCRFRKNHHHHTICDNAQEKNPSLNIAYEVMNLVNDDQQTVPSSQSQRHGTVPQTVTQSRRISSSCNLTAVDCQLQCEQELVFCDEEHAQAEFYESKPDFYYYTYQFWVFCMLALVGSMCHGALFTLSDTACYETLRGTDSDYGRQRFWGSVGWGLAAPLAGYLNHLCSKSSNREDYSAGWYLMAVMSGFCLINLIFMKLPDLKKSSSMCSDVRKVMLSRHFMLMELNVLLMGILNAYASNYVLWYMQTLDSTRLQMGLALTVQCLFGEGPFLFISGLLISKLGHWHCVTIVFLGFTVRFLAYYLIFNPWIILPVEILHGVTFGLCYATMTSYGEHASLAGTEATVQGILGGIYQGIGNGIGCLIAGISFDLYGGRRSFLLVSIFSACLACSHYLLCLICKPQKGEGEKQNSVCEV